MVLYHYLVVFLIWIVYAAYCFIQYSDKLKASPIFMIVAVTYSLLASFLWVYLSRNLDQKNTLDYALLWDGGVNLIAFLVPILIFGDKLKTHTAIGMTFIFSGMCIVLFYEKIHIFFK